MGCLVPLAYLIGAALAGELGADPAAAVSHVTGIWALNLLFGTLLVTPLRKATGWCWLVRLRRTVALFCFFYAGLHLLSYLAFDQSFDGAGILKDLTTRPFIAVGFCSFVLMIPLAATSTDRMAQRLGGRHWRHLHRLVYVVAAASVFHYLWLVKRDITVPAGYALVLCLLLYARMMPGARSRSAPWGKGDTAATVRGKRVS
ncbi:sulfite oxidase heme-binding subunit YedZ [Candidatus Methylocalor cossyra]